MNKPKDFDSVQAYGEWQPLPAGGYVCRIMQVEETVSKAGNEMIKISLDIAEGEYQSYFANSYKSDTRPDRKWGCVAHQLEYDPVNPNCTNKGFKTFTSAVTESNKGFEIPWGNNFGAGFANKLVGCIFRREEYMGTDGKSHFSTKPYMFRSVETIRKGGFKIPDDKLLGDGTGGYYPQNTNTNAPLPADFQEVISESELPF
ncbi:MAG: DUF669 domain-containing protein [Ruminococcus sp.]|nr:DUF669 domain-containing protein [Ruminococcus sp.]